MPDRRDTIVPSLLESDFFVPDSLSTDTMAMEKAPVIEAPIDYNAEDSIIGSFDGQKVYLYNNAKVTYQQIELTAYYIELDLETKEVYAEGIKDSTGTLIQKPIFKDGNDEFESNTLRYNFESEKGIITDVVTEQGEGFVHSQRTKKISKDAFVLKDGKYTTCDAPHPHFYLHLTKAKVISKNKIITGPAYMVLEDFPLYFPILPFGYFPNTPSYSSGILIPTYGEENNRGFFLREGGYYWAASEYFDLAVQGDIYSKGSWATKLHTNYRKRYKYNGGFDFRYNLNVYKEKGDPDYNPSKQFAITWNHSQDAKANPNQTMVPGNRKLF
jgi:lipopolysaccharide assembly outer membrane protein LptD (OstA)